VLGAALCAVQVIGSQIERQQDDNACLAYWLTNTVTLLHLLQRNIKPASGSTGSVKRVAAAAGRSIMGGLFGRQPGAGEQRMRETLMRRL
jgi:myosin-5